MARQQVLLALLCLLIWAHSSRAAPVTEAEEVGMLETDTGAEVEALTAAEEEEDTPLTEEQEPESTIEELAEQEEETVVEEQVAADEESALLCSLDSCADPDLFSVNGCEEFCSNPANNIIEQQIVFVPSPSPSPFF